MDTIVVGIDVSKDKLDIALRPGGEVFATSRDAQGLDALIARLAPMAPAAVAVEATGGFETAVAASLAAAGGAAVVSGCGGLPVVVVNPAQVRCFAQALGKRAKTDPVDAAAIAHFTGAAKLDIRPLPYAAAQLLADLAARRRQIIQMIVAGRQRQRRFVEKHLQKSIARLLKALEKELSPLDRSIDDAVRGSPAWREKEDLLAPVPGAGPVIARTLIAELPELGQLDRRQIAALGLACPLDTAIREMERQEFYWRRQTGLAGGAVHGRALAARTNPVLRAFKQRLIDSGKPKLAAVIAVARKLLTILNAMLRDKKPWRYGSGFQNPWPACDNG